MGRKFSDYRLFFREFRRHFHTTGAVLPSGRALAAALSTHVRSGHGPRRILEVGPGTGAVTASIVAALGPRDRFDMVELNDQFVQHLHQRFASEPAFAAVRDRTHVIHGRLEDLPEGETYDLVISCLPLNNFAVADVEAILRILSRLMKPGGTLTFFEYMAVRPARSLICSSTERQRLRGISRLLGDLLDRHAVHCDWIWLNVPPAWVHHVRFDGAASSKLFDRSQHAAAPQGA